MKKKKEKKTKQAKLKKNLKNDCPKKEYIKRMRKGKNKK